MTLPPPRFAIHVTAVGDGAVRIEVMGEIDMVTAPALDRALRDQTGAGRDVMLDFSRTTFMDSAGVRVVIDGIERSRRQSRRLIVEPQPPHQVHRILEITGVSAVLQAGRADLSVHSH